MTALLAPTASALDRAVRTAQRAWRCPSLSAGLVRDGELLWSSHLGWCDVEQRRTADDATQYQIGSITKTFTALLVMALRDEGKLALDDTIGQHLGTMPQGDLTIRAMLAHASGLQREFASHVWETLDFPDNDRLLAEMADVERVLPPHFEYHYSNLAFALLGLLVERVGGAPWEEQLRRRVTTPLEIPAVGLTPDEATRAKGYYTHPYTHEATPEPVAELRASAPIGGLWSGVADLARYAAFIADPDPAVIAPATMEEMCRPLILTDLVAWTRGYGLGYSMYRIGEHITVGHDGGMPGFLTGLRVNRPGKVGAVVFANGSSHCDPGGLANQLVAMVLDAEPRMPETWYPEVVDPVLAELTGTWWTEGEEIRFVVEDGSLVSGEPGVGWEKTRSRFERESDDVFRVAEGRERGEKLVVVRDASGAVERMRFATYAVTREPLTFDRL